MPKQCDRYGPGGHTFCLHARPCSRPPLAGLVVQPMVLHGHLVDGKVRHASQDTVCAFATYAGSCRASNVMSADLQCVV